MLVEVAFPRTEDTLADTYTSEHRYLRVAVVTVPFLPVSVFSGRSHLCCFHSTPLGEYVCRKVPQREYVVVAVHRIPHVTDM